MSNYQTSLKTWGSTGSEYPDGYNYVEGEQPVDAWDNFFNSNVITDIDNILSIINDRIESDVDTSFPSSPEDGHLVYRTDTGEEELYVYDSTNATWHRLMRADAAVLAGDLTASGGETIWDESATEIPDSAMGTISDATLADPRTDVSDSGTAVVSDVTDINFSSSLSVTDDGDGSVTVDATATDTRTDVSENGTQVVADTSDINFTDTASATTSVTDDGDGTVSVSVSVETGDQAIYYAGL